MLPQYSKTTVLLQLFVFSFLILTNCQIKAEYFGEACSNVGPIMGQQCNTQSILTCRNGVCGCLYTWMVYHDFEALCVAPAGKHCGLDHNYWIIDCVENASCEPIQYEDSTDPSPFVCVCNQGFVEQTKKGCNDDQFQPNGTSDPYTPRLCCPA